MSFLFFQIHEHMTREEMLSVFQVDHESGKLLKNLYSLSKTRAR